MAESCGGADTERGGRAARADSAAAVRLAAQGRARQRGKSARKWNRVCVGRRGCAITTGASCNISNRSRCRCADGAGTCWRRLVDAAIGAARCLCGVMIIPSGAVRVLVATRPVDFRKGADGLCALVQETLRSDPYSGVIYVFRSKRADRVKLLLWDGSGLVLVSKRLEQGAFRWPAINDGVMRLTSSQLAALFEGL